MKVKIPLLSLCLLLFTACNSDPETYNLSDNYSEVAAIPATLQSAPSPPTQTNTIDRKLIKTGLIKFETGDIVKTMASVKQATEALGGYIASEFSNTSDYQVSTSVTVRVPSDQFDSFINRVSERVTKFDERDITSLDVTEEYMDLNVRIVTKKKLEQRYLEILKAARTVKEILGVETELGKVREEIERAEGRLKYLKSQVSMSTVTIEFYQTTETAKAEKDSFYVKIKNGLTNGLNLIEILFFAIVNIWPLLVLVAIGYLVYRSRKGKTKS